MGGDVSRIRGDDSALKNLKLRNLTNLSPGYILKMKQRFESASEEYLLDAKALKEFFKCRDSEIEELFRLFDADKTGSIDSYEFVCALGMMAKGSLNEKAELIFSFYDFDSSKSISKDELTVLMTNCLTALKYLEGKKAPTVSEVEQKTNEFFAEADEDTDGTVHLKEFVSYVNKDKEVLTVLKSYGVASSEDLGKDFGRAKSEVPDVDSDLEEESNPSDLTKSHLKDFIKDGELPDEEAEKDLLQRRQQSAAKPGERNTFPPQPDNYQKSKVDQTAPDASLELEYTYGFRSRDVRNNLRYTADGELAYHCAGVAVVMDKKKNLQRHFLGHRDDIHCLAVDPSGELIATGEIGIKPRLCIWNSKTMQELFQIISPMTKGIKHVAFSKDGKRLACSDMDTEHSIYIFDLTKKLSAGETLKPLAQGPGSKQPIMSIGFNHSGDTVIATGVRTVSFFKINGNSLELKTGSGWGKTPADTVLCQALAGQSLFTGTFLGEIISWTDSIIQTRISAHKGKINCIYASRDGTLLVTGGADGNIITWSVKGASLEAQKTFNLKQIGLQSLKAFPTSVCLSNDGENILFGTRGGEICELNVKTSKPTVHMRSHFDGELWGLTVHPSKPLFYTFGRDAVLAVWDLKTRRQLKHCKLESEGDALGISHSGQILVIGFNNGALIALDQDADFTPIARRKDRNGAPITCIQFTPNDKICAVGGQDQIIMTYDVQAQFKPLKKLKGSAQAILHMDFSLDSQLLQTHDNWFDMETGKNDKQSITKWKNEIWNTWTRTEGWQVSGIYPLGASGEDINAVDRSADGKILATADDFGLVKLFRFPAVGASHNKYYGHSSQVTNIKFSRGNANQQYVVSTGGEDKTILQWRYNFDKEGAAESSKKLDEIEEEESHAGVLSSLQEKDDFAEQDLGEGDQAMVGIRENDGALKALTPPNWKVPKNAYDPPTAGVTLAWAHGFRSWDVRGNLKYDKSGNIVYTTAGLGIVHDTKAKKQDFFNVHGNDIVAMAIHPELDIIATGQMANEELDEIKSGAPAKMVEQGGFKGKSQSVAGKLVPILIWRASTREVITRIYGFHRGQINGLKFSPSGNKLLSSSDLGGTAIYNWANGTKLADGGIGGLNMNWKNEDEYAVASQSELITYVHNGTMIKGKKCLLGDHKPCSVNFVFKAAIMITGGVNGEIVTWNGLNGSNPGKTQKSTHTSGIWAIEKAFGKTAETAFYTGGNEGKVVLWNAQFQPTQTIDIATLSTFALKSGVRSLDIKSDGTLLVGTSGAEVMEVDKQGKLIQVVVQGHFRGVTAKLEHPEVWGLTVHPTEQIFASAGADKTVRIWNSKRMIKCSAQLAHDPTALDWSPNGKFIAVGDRWGYLSILDAESLELLGTQQTTLTSKATKGTENGVWVQAIHWSPDGTKVALGTHGGRSKLEIAQIDERGKIKAIKGNEMGLASAITELDWSQDSKFVIVNSSDVFNLETGKRDPYTSAYNQTQWQTWTGRGFIANGTGEAKCRDRSHNGLFMATGDRFSNLNIFRCPTVEGAQKKSFIGHSSFVTNVKFTAHDDYIITTGGNDLSVFVWNTDIYDEPELESEQQEEEEHPDIPISVVKTDLAKENRQKLKQELKPLKPVQKEFDEFAEEELGEGDQFLAVIPWKNQVKAPTGFKHPNKQNLPPNIQLEVDWIYGYCGDQNSLSYLEDDSVAYPAAAIGVCYKSEGHSQRYFQGHEGRITCIAFAPDKRHVATGDGTIKSVVIIWDAITMKQVVKITSKNLKKGVCKVAYSPSGKYLAITDNSEDSNVIVVDANTGAEVAVSRKCVGNIAFEDDQTFVSVGKGIQGSQFAQWKINASSITSKQGAFGQNSKMIHGVVFDRNTALTGNVNGDVYLWNGTQIKEVKKFGHTRLIEAITVTDDAIFFGGKDSKITITNREYVQICQFSLENLKDSVNTQVRAITLNKKCDRIMVATFGHELIEIPITKKIDPATAKIQVHGHYAPMSTWTNEVWGLNTFKDKDRMITSSDDGTLKIWDAVAHRQVACIPLDLDGEGKKIPANLKTNEVPYSARGRAVDVSAKGDYLAVGMFDGTLRCYDAKTFELQVIKRCVKGKNADKEWIQDLKFSPDGSKLAVTTHEGKIWLYDVKNQFAQIGKEFGKTTSFITQMDWSLDGELIRTVDASYELLYYTAADGKQQTAGASAYKDTQWATHNVIYSFQAQGIWQAGQDGTDINFVDVSNKPVIDKMQLIASGNDNDKVHVFRYPSVDEKSKPVVGHGHASDVTKVKFNYKDSLLISTGGNDTTVIQWKIVLGDQK